MHRIGRTGRAGASGDAISFCDFDEKAYLKDIEKLTRKAIPVVEDHPFPMQVFEPAPKPQPRPPRRDKAVTPERDGQRGGVHPARRGPGKPPVSRRG